MNVIFEGDAPSLLNWPSQSPASGIEGKMFVSTVKYLLTLWSPVITVIRRSKSSGVEKKHGSDIIILYIKTFIPESPNSADRSIQRLYTERYKQNAIDTVTGLAIEPNDGSPPL
jgi:hypothetical protein